MAAETLCAQPTDVDMPDVGPDAAIPEPMSESSASSQRQGGRRRRHVKECAPRPPPPVRAAPDQDKPCTANGKRPLENNFEHCPQFQPFVRCGPHHRAENRTLDQEDIDRLYDIWARYKDNLSWPWYDKKPKFSDEDFETYFSIAQKVVDACVAEYKQPLVLDQATISNTNHIGHPPHADNVQFDSVWWKGKRIRREDEVVAAQDGAYILWRMEKTNFRNYSVSTALESPDGYEGGEVQFFDKWGDKDPVNSFKCDAGTSMMFCGCHRNIHAVTGVKSGFRLVLLVWTRPTTARVPDPQAHVCYFRPGTGDGVWMTCQDIERQQARLRMLAGESEQYWTPREDQDLLFDKCDCSKCRVENQKVSWDDCKDVAPMSPRSEESTCTGGSRPGDDADGASGEESSPSEFPHCPYSQGKTLCTTHERHELKNCLTSADIKHLHKVWDKKQDDLSNPWYDKKPDFSDWEFNTFRACAQRIVDEMAKLYGEALVLDQATISCTNHHGHPPHADNVQMESVWWDGKQIKQKDEVTAARGGAEVLWTETKTTYRNYSASVALSDPEEYGGGVLEFYKEWGQKEPIVTHQFESGSGMCFCGCQKCIHAVTGVKWGFRLVLLVWTRPVDQEVPEDQKHVCYFRPGTGCSVWLTTQDMERYPKRSRSGSRRRGRTWSESREKNPWKAASKGSSKDNEESWISDEAWEKR